MNNLLNLESSGMLPGNFSIPYSIALRRTSSLILVYTDLMSMYSTAFSYHSLYCQKNLLNMAEKGQ